MQDQPLPEPIPVSGAPVAHARVHPVPAQRPQCRALTAGGHRCKNKVVGGLHLCFSHHRNRRPALPDPRRVSVPLLEDASAIQLMATQILHGILSRTLDHDTARAATALLRVAAMTLPRPRSRVAEPDDRAGDTVCHVARDYEDFISADGDLDEPELNPSCSVPESVEAVRELLDTFDPQNHCAPEDRREERPALNPTHNWEHCPCFTCADYRRWIADANERDRLAGALP
ncbi:MAG TPA: hypothetical protein VME68_07515 [Acidobacteriaceae bacterium]|nr:hypothetical protein [Acidobacteriaceae bacterium]